MFILIFSFFNYKFSVYSGIGITSYDFNRKNSINLDHLNFAKILLGYEDVKIGTSLFYSNFSNFDLFTFAPFILEYEKKFGIVNSGVEITTSFWCRNNDEDEISKFVNVSSYFKILIAKGLNTRFLAGLNYQHLKKAEFVPFIKWDLDFIILENDEYLSDFYNESNKKLFYKHMIQGLLGGISNIILGNLLDGERIKDVKPLENYTILFISPVIGEGIGSSLMNRGLNYDKDNNILDFITLGISEGMLSGFISGFGFGALYDPLSDVPIDEKYNIGNMLGYGIAFSFLGGFLGTFSGLVNYFLAR